MSSAMFTVKPTVVKVAKQFAGSKFQKMALASAPTTARVSTTIQNIHGKSGRKCMLTNKKANNGWTVSFSHIRNKKLQGVNLQYKRIYWPEQQRYIRLRISTKALKTIQKKGLEAMAAEAGLDLMSLSYTDADPKRKEWLVENGAAPVKKNKRAPTGQPKKLFVPKWKKDRIAKKGLNEAAETKAFAEKWGMEVA